MAIHVIGDHTTRLCMPARRLRLRCTCARRSLSPAAPAADRWFNSLRAISAALSRGDAWRPTNNSSTTNTEEMVNQRVARARAGKVGLPYELREIGFGQV